VPCRRGRLRYKKHPDEHSLPAIVFGDGTRRRLPELAQPFGSRVLLVTGAASFRHSPHRQELLDGLQARGLAHGHLAVSGEPSPQLVDDAARQFRGASIDVVIGIGGGSVLDAAKAIAGLLRVDHSVMDFLEGVGPELPYPGPSVPFIAVPTTAGTGSEATKNAVLSVQGEGGFKKSFRHEMLAPRYAVLDPELLAGCSAPLIAADGMDALTQLLESYVSLKANPFTDALVMSGIRAVRDSLLPWHHGQGDLAAHRANMTYAALLSGITLAQVGWARYTGWRRRWARSSPSRTAWPAALWWRPAPPPICEASRNARRTAQRWPSTPMPARC